MPSVVLKSQRTTEALDKVIYEVVLDDIQTVLRYVAAEEIQAQRALQNPPTSLLIDNRADTNIYVAQKRVQAFFGNVDDLRKAVYEAWNVIQNFTRRRTGRAAASYEVWYREQRIGNNPSAIEAFLPTFNPGKDYFRIVGPVLVYGRKIYWSPKGSTKVTKRQVFKSPGVAIKLVRIRGVMNLAEQAVAKRYRGLAITEDWVVTSALPTDGRTPGLWLGFRKRGTLLNGGSNG